MLCAFKERSVFPVVDFLAFDLFAEFGEYVPLFCFVIGVCRDLLSVNSLFVGRLVSLQMRVA
jgi:hypothetical protein